MLSLDDYFITEVEKEERDPDTGKKVKKKVLLIQLFILTKKQDILDNSGYQISVCDFGRVQRSVGCFSKQVNVT